MDFSSLSLEQQSSLLEALCGVMLDDPGPQYQYPEVQQKIRQKLGLQVNQDLLRSTITWLFEISPSEQKAASKKFKRVPEVCKDNENDCFWRV